MDYKAILNLMKEMNQTDLTVLEIKEEGTSIRMEKGGYEIVTPVKSEYQRKTDLNTTIVNSILPEVTDSGVKIMIEKLPEQMSGEKMLSPMVGTFYSQSSPDKPSFVKVGDIVSKGQTLCIIEAMKLMNEIESEYAGEIIEVLCKNEDMVEFGQPMFVIR